jgi:hypothetical protein
MNNDSKHTMKEAINEAAEHLTGKLPQSPKHPAGRNPHAHIAQVLKALLGKSYTECDDHAVPGLLRLIKQIKENPF